MEEFDIYKDIRERTDGNVYFGVVGPVRAGKSTFIRSFMQKLVMPRMKDAPEKDRILDELPQSGTGRTIMTTQPKFIPGEAVSVTLANGVDAGIRLVDCVGYMVDGAEGSTDGDKPRMVRTPWNDGEIPFSEAADIGTRKVISEHATIGIVVTTDGSISTELPRAAYVPAEERVVGELKELGKPFVIVLNSSVPDDPETKKIAAAMSEKYGAQVLPLNVLEMGEDEILALFEAVLMEFPLRRVDFELSRWLRALPSDNSLISSLLGVLREKCAGMSRMRDYKCLENVFDGSADFSPIKVKNVSLGDGRLTFEVEASGDLFYKALSEECGMDIADDYALMSCIKELAAAKREYDKLAPALKEVDETGYGVVIPTMNDMTLEEPQIVKRGSQFGVRLKASAPSLHIMRVDIEAEVSPIVGTEQQSEDLVKYLLSEFENDPQGIWETNMFGKSLHSLVNEGLSNKLNAMPPDAQKKMRRALSRIVNEGKGGVLCVLL